MKDQERAAGPRIGPSLVSPFQVIAASNVGSYSWNDFDIRIHVLVESCLGTEYILEGVPRSFDDRSRDRFSSQPCLFVDAFDFLSVHCNILLSPGSY